MRKITWQKIRKITQISILVGFLLLFVLTRTQRVEIFWSNIFFYLDPLLAVSSLLAGKVIIVGFSASIFIILITIIFGRAWCGWICPMGTIIDLIKPRRNASVKGQSLSRMRIVKYLLLFVIIFSALFGNQTLTMLDPITILNRTISSSIWPAAQSSIYGVESFFIDSNFCGIFSTKYTPE